MGRTLVVATALALFAGSAAAQQPTPTPTPTPTPPSPTPAPGETAAQLFAQGQDFASRGDYASAIGVYTRALELEPTNWEIKLALADAERLLNQCERAIPHYKEALEAAPETEKARVQASLEQCPTAVAIAPPVTNLPPPPVPPEPRIIYREGPPSMVTVGLLGGAGACLGVSVALFLASRSSDSDADAARSYDDYERISARATREKIASAVFLGAALGLGGYAVYRIKYRKTESAEVAVTPTADGGAMVVRGSW